MKKVITSNLNPEKEICQTINYLINEITNEKLLDKIQKGEFLELIFGNHIAGEFSSFQVACEPMKSIYENHDALYLKEDSDAAFFEAACSFPESTILVKNLLNLIIKHNLKVGKYRTPYRDDEQVFGLTPAIALIRSNSIFCKLYGEFLKTLDMNHEVHESIGLLYAFEKYGCHLDTMRLLAICLFSASGQHSDENLEYLLEKYPINAFLENQNNFDLSFNFMLDEFKQVHDNHKKFYSTVYLESFKHSENGDNKNLLKIFKKIEAFHQSIV